jgi:hypothetical protein
LAASLRQGLADPRRAACVTKENLVTDRLARPDNRVLRLLASVLLASLFVAQPTLAQDDPAAPAAASTDIENEMPPGDPPPAAKVVVEEKPEAGSIRDITEKRRPYGVSLDMHVPWLEGIGIGFKIGAEIPIMHNGFLPSVNDSFSLEPRFLMAYQYWRSFQRVDNMYVLSFTPAIAALWSFYFKTNLRAYAFVSMGFTIVSAVTEIQGSTDGLSNRFYHDVGVGGFWDFAAHWSLRAEMGYAGMRVGIAYMI